MEEMMDSRNFAPFPTVCLKSLQYRCLEHYNCMVVGLNLISNYVSIGECNNILGVCTIYRHVE